MIENINRDVAVARIRRSLIALREEGKSICRIAADKKILCRGFDRDDDEELRFRYAAVIDDSEQLTREAMETRANAWQIERQQREGAPLCCDVQYMFYETCRSWDDFSNDDLSRFCRELRGENVCVTGQRHLPVL